MNVARGEGTQITGTTDGEDRRQRAKGRWTTWATRDKAKRSTEDKRAHPDLMTKAVGKIRQRKGGAGLFDTGFNIRGWGDLAHKVIFGSFPRGRGGGGSAEIAYCTFGTPGSEFYSCHPLDVTRYLVRGCLTLNECRGLPSLRLMSSLTVMSSAITAVTESSFACPSCTRLFAFILVAYFYYLPSTFRSQSLTLPSSSPPFSFTLHDIHAVHGRRSQHRRSPS